MNETTHQDSSKDVAWAAVITPFSKQQLEDFCTNVERLFRINPYIEFKEWTQQDTAHFQAKGINQSQTPAFEFSHDFCVVPLLNGFQINYKQGLKTSTSFICEEHENGSKLIITDDYSGMAKQDRESRLHEVDKSLIKWAENIQAYIIMWQRWSWLAPWRWYMRRIWQPMKPMARRITYMLLWITLVELALIALGVGIYLVEYA